MQKGGDSQHLETIVALMRETREINEGNDHLVAPLEMIRSAAISARWWLGSSPAGSATTRRCRSSVRSRHTVLDCRCSPNVLATVLCAQGRTRCVCSIKFLSPCLRNHLCRGTWDPLVPCPFRHNLPRPSATRRHASAHRRVAGGLLPARRARAGLGRPVVLCCRRPRQPGRRPSLPARGARHDRGRVGGGGAPAGREGFGCRGRRRRVLRAGWADVSIAGGVGDLLRAHHCGLGRVHHVRRHPGLLQGRPRPEPLTGLPPQGHNPPHTPRTPPPQPTIGLPFAQSPRPFASLLLPSPPFALHHCACRPFSPPFSTSPSPCEDSHRRQCRGVA